MLLVFSDILQIIGQGLSRACLCGLWSRNAHSAGKYQRSFETAGRGRVSQRRLAMPQQLWRKHKSFRRDSAKAPHPCHETLVDICEEGQ